MPKELDFNVGGTFLRRESDEVALSAEPKDWSAYLNSAPVASPEFMEDVEDLPVQERDRLFSL